MFEELLADIAPSPWAVACVCVCVCVYVRVRVLVRVSPRAYVAMVRLYHRVTFFMAFTFSFSCLTSLKKLTTISTH